MRCFVAVELSPELRNPLVRLLREELPRSKEVRWCTEDQLHITLKFLGEVAEDRLPGVGEAVVAAAGQIQPFTIRLAALGCFPSPRSARVLWCGIDDPADGCARWLSIADPLLAELGFEREARAFTPHVTLGRSKDRGGAEVMRQVLETVAAPPPRDMQVDHVVLFESRLSPAGARYIPVMTARLGQR